VPQRRDPPSGRRHPTSLAAPGAPDRAALATFAFDARTFEGLGSAPERRLRRRHRPPGALVPEQLAGGALTRLRIDVLFLTTALVPPGRGRGSPRRSTASRDLLFGVRRPSNECPAVLRRRASATGLIPRLRPTEWTTIFVLAAGGGGSRRCASVRSGGPVAHGSSGLRPRPLGSLPAPLGCRGSCTFGGLGLARGYFGPARKLTAEAVQCRRRRALQKKETGSNRNRPTSAARLPTGTIDFVARRERAS